MSNIYAVPNTVFLGMLRQDEEAIEEVKLNGRKGSILVDSFRTSTSIKNIVNVEIEQTISETLLRIKLNPQKLLYLQRKPRKIEGFIQLAVKSLISQNSLSNSLAQQNSVDLVDNKEQQDNYETINIPVLVFISTDEWLLYQTQKQ